MFQGIVQRDLWAPAPAAWFERLVDAASAQLRALGDAVAVDSRRWILFVPVCFGAGIAACFALPAIPSRTTVLIAAGVGLFAALSACLSASTWSRAAAIALMLLSAGFVRADWRTEAVGAPVLARAGVYSLEATVLTASAREPGYRLVLHELAIDGLATEATPSRVQLTTRHADPSPRPGDRIAVTARLLPPSGPALPGGFDYARHAWFSQIGGVGFSYGRLAILEAANGGGPATRVSALRTAVAGRITELVGGSVGAIAAALLTGLRGGIEEEVWRAFQRSGLAHLLAISGLHMSLVAGTIFLVVRWTLPLVAAGFVLRVPAMRPAACVATAGAGFYLLLSGATVPTQRAFIMVAIAMLAILIGRAPFSMRLLAAAALLVLAIAPESLDGASFQMSFAAVIGLVAVYESRALRARFAGLEARLPRPLLYLAAVAATTLVASTVTLPFTAFHFQSVPTYGVLANLIAVPVTTFWVMPAGLLGLTLMPIGLDAPAFHLMAAGIELILATARSAADLPGAVVLVPLLPKVFLLLTAVGGLWLALWESTRLRLLGLVPLGAALLVLVLHRPPDVVVDRWLDMAAVRGESGVVRLGVWQRDGFTLERWTEGLAARSTDEFPEPGAQPVSDILCDRIGCIVTRRGHSLALARSPGAVFEDCARADLAVLRLGPQRCPPGDPALAIGSQRLWRSQGMTFTFRPSGIEVREVQESRGDWPWVRR